MSPLPKDVAYLVTKTPALIRATADVAGTVNQLVLHRAASSYRGWLARDLAEVAGRTLALLATLEGGKVSEGSRALIEAHRDSYLSP